MFSKSKCIFFAAALSFGIFLLFSSPAMAYDLTLGWNKNPDSEDITHYTIYWAIHPFDTTQIGSENGPDSVEKIATSQLKDPDLFGEPSYVAIHTLTGLDANIPYFLRITAVNEFHEGPLSDTIETMIPPEGDTEAPTQPTIDASVESSHSILLQLHASDNVGIHHYMLRRGNSHPVEVINPTYQDTGLSPNTTYTYSVIAFDSAGNESPISEPVTVTTPPQPEPDNQNPTAPRNVVAQDVADTHVNLRWDASTDNVGVVRYEIHCDKKNSITVNASQTNYQYSGLLPNTTYEFQIIAFDAENNFGQATPLSVTTQAENTGDASLYGILCFINTIKP